MTENPGAASALVGSTLRVVAIDGEPTLPSPTAELTFAADGAISGRATVNRLMGRYTIDGDVVMFGPLATTMMAGPQEAMDQEHRLTRLLTGHLQVRVGAEGRVTLTTGDGATIDLDEALLEE